MSDIREWFTNAGSNSEPSPDGWPEGMDKAGVNNSARENMASVRKLIENFPWLQVVRLADTVTKGSDDQVVIANTNYTAIFTAGARIRIGDGATFVERTIDTSSYGTNTTLNLVVGELPVVQTAANAVEYHCGKNATAGYRDMGTGAGQVLTLTDLADGALVDMGAGNGFDADTVDGSHVEAIVLASALIVENNMLVNTEFRTWREGLSFTAAPDLTYVCDQWKALVESGNHDFARSSTTPPGALYSIFVGHQATSQAGIYQFAEQQNCVVAVGDVASLQFEVKGGGQAPDVIRYAIVEWTGAPDDITAEPITTWPVSEGTDPTLAGSFDIIASDEIILDGSWQSVGLLNAPVSTSMKNLGVMIWVDDQDVAVGDVWNVSQVKLQSGPVGGVYEHPRGVAHLLELNHYWRKSFLEETAPAHNTESDTAVYWRAASSDTARNYILYPLGVPMLKEPTVSFWNPSTASPAGSDFVRNINGGVDLPIDAERHTADHLQWSVSFSTSNKNDDFRVHFSADARFF